MSERTESNKSAGSSDSTTRRRRRWRMPLIVIGIVLGVLALAVWSALKPGNLEELRAEWEAAGGVDDLAKLMPEPVPDEENAAVIYRRLFPEITAATQAREFTRTLEESPHDPHDLDDLDDLAHLKALDTLLAPHEELLRELLEAAMMEECHWGEDGYSSLSSATALTFGGQMQMPDAARLMSADLRRQLLRGDLEAAAQRFEALMNMASQTMQPATVLNVLVAIAIRTTALETFREALQDQPRMRPDPSWFDRPAPGEVTGQMILHESAYALPMIAAATDVVRVLRGRNEAAYLELMLQPYRQKEMPFWQQEWSGAEIADSVFLLPASMAAPAIDRAVEAIWWMEGRFLQLETAFELRLHRAEHGAYPETWETPANPLTGEPIEYERAGAGFRLHLRHPRTEDGPGIPNVPSRNRDVILEWR